MDAEGRMERKMKAQERKYGARHKPKQVGRSVFTIQAAQAKRAAQIKDGRVTKMPSRPFSMTPGTAMLGWQTAVSAAPV